MSKKPKPNQVSITEKFSLFDGKVDIYRDKYTGKRWNFRYWEKEKKKYFRKSLFTTDKTTAIKNATELFEKLNKPKEKFITDEFTLNDGDVVVYRADGRSGSVWQFRTWVKEESKYFRKSLFTRDKELAIERAKELYLDIHAKLRNKEQVFDKTVRQLVDVYLEEQKKRIRVGAVGKGNIGITEGRFKTIKTQVEKHMMGFLGEKTKLSSITKDKFKNNYTVYRRRKSPNVVDDTIINERATIGNVFTFAFEKNFINFQKLLWEEMSKKSKSREAFTVEEYRELYDYLKKWNKNEKDKKIIEQKNFVKNFILILSNTGLRFGELRELRWYNVKIINDGKKTHAVINVDVSKTGVRKNVVGRRGDLFLKVRKISKFTSPQDLIFVDNKTGEGIKKEVYYKHWDEIIKNTSLKEKIEKPSYYCLRHTYATFRLYANVPVFDLAENMGCSVKFIEDHYGHVNRLRRVDQLTKDFKNDGIKILMGID